MLAYEKILYDNPNKKLFFEAGCSLDVLNIHSNKVFKICDNKSA
jgi:hypothetical protein